MKKILLLFLLLSTVSYTKMYASSPRRIYLSASQANKEISGSHRMPARNSEILYDDETKTLIFTDAWYGCDIMLLTPEGETAYSSVIEDGELELPSYLTREYEILVVRDGIVFVGFIEL